ncbi:MAG TPA: phosphoglycerate mutase family protein [Acidimicrobiales bacterium]|jgi:8-oxo-dGTP diphosphatase
MSWWLIRHAHAGDRHSWGGTDAERPLSEKGWRQSTAIADALMGGDDPITTDAVLLSSPVVRCIQTLSPLAERLGTSVIQAGALLEGSQGAGVAEVLVAYGDRPVVLSSHGDVIPSLLDHLGSAGMVRSDDDRCQKASVWFVDTVEGAPVSAHYFPPPPL